MEDIKNLQAKIQAKIDGLTGGEDSIELAQLALSSKGLRLNTTKLDQAIQSALNSLDDAADTAELTVARKLLAGTPVGTQFAATHEGTAKTTLSKGDLVRLTPDGGVVPDKVTTPRHPLETAQGKDSAIHAPEYQNLVKSILKDSASLVEEDGVLPSFSVWSASHTTGADRSNRISLNASRIKIDGPKVGFRLHHGDFAPMDLSLTLDKDVHSVSPENNWNQYGFFVRTRRINSSGVAEEVHGRIQCVNVQVSYTDAPDAKFNQPILVSFISSGPDRGEVLDTLVLPQTKVQHQAAMQFSSSDTARYTLIKDPSDQIKYDLPASGHTMMFNVPLRLSSGVYGWALYDTGQAKFLYSNAPKAVGNTWEVGVYNYNEWIKYDTFPKLSHCWYSDMRAAGRHTCSGGGWTVNTSPYQNIRLVQGRFSETSNHMVKAFSKDGSFATDWVDATLSGLEWGSVAPLRMGVDMLQSTGFGYHKTLLDTAAKQFIGSRKDELSGTGNAGTTYTHDDANSRFVVSVASGASDGNMGAFTVNIPAADILGTPQSQTSGNATSSNYDNVVLWLGSKQVSASDKFFAFPTGATTRRMFGLLKVKTDDATRPYHLVYFYVDVDTSQSSPTYTATVVRTLRGSATASSPSNLNAYVFGTSADRFVMEAPVAGLDRIQSSDAADKLTGQWNNDAGFSDGMLAVLSNKGVVKVARKGASFSEINMRHNFNRVYVSKVGGYATGLEDIQKLSNPRGDYAERFHTTNPFRARYVEASNRSEGDYNHDRGSAKYNEVVNTRRPDTRPLSHDSTEQRLVSLTPLMGIGGRIKPFTMDDVKVEQNGTTQPTATQLRAYYLMYPIGADSSGDVWFSRSICLYGTALLIRINPVTLEQWFYFFESPYMTTEFIARGVEYDRWKCPYVYNTYSGRRYQRHLIQEEVGLAGLMAHQFKVQGDDLLFAGSDETDSSQYRMRFGAPIPAPKHNVLWAYPLSEIKSLGRAGYKSNYLRASKAKKGYVSDPKPGMSLGNATSDPYSFYGTDILRNRLAEEGGKGLTNPVGVCVNDAGQGDPVKVRLEVPPVNVSELESSGLDNLYEFAHGLAYRYSSDPDQGDVPDPADKSIGLIASGSHRWAPTQVVQSGSTNEVSTTITIPRIDPSNAWAEITGLRFATNGHLFSRHGLEVEILDATTLRFIYSYYGDPNSHGLRAADIQWRIIGRPT